MIDRLIIRWQLWLAMHRRKAARPARSEAARRSHSAELKRRADMCRALKAGGWL